MPVLINDVPVICINQAAVAYHVPAPLILSIMKQENGRNGDAIRNKNGTYDLGVLQINSRWLPTLSKYGYTRKDLQFDPCKNLMAGAWILANNLAEGKSLWSGIGDYHSHTPKYNTAYRNKVYRHYQKISVALDV
jgi:soluble lytic murein transglycosylase-like protein